MKNETQKEIERRVNDLFPRIEFHTQNLGNSIERQNRIRFMEGFRLGAEWALRNMK